MENIEFYDMEASGLSHISFPVEFGSASLDGLKIHTHEFLIKPTNNWLNRLGAWDRDAESIHKLSIEFLMDEGIPVQEVAQNINDILIGKTIYSDSPKWDHFWIQQIFEESNIKMNFSLSEINIPEFLTKLINDKNLDIDYEKLKEKILQTDPITHRAADDAKHWITMLKTIKKECI